MFSSVAVCTDRSISGGGVLKEWTLTLYGSKVTPKEVQDRKRYEFSEVWPAYG